MNKFKSKKSNYNKRRKCELCELNMNYVDYKNVEFLAKYITGTGQIKPKSASGNCAKDQRKVANAIKRARFMALMPYTKERVRVVKSAA